MMISHSQLHYHILENIIETGHAPCAEKLAVLLSHSKEDVVIALRALQEYHGVVLHPNDPSKVWVIHPFSMAPTNFTVKVDSNVWYGNCAWCSLGCAALLQKNCTITTSYGAHGDRVDVHIVDGELVEKDLYVHFPIPMRKAWDNVIYTCSTMLLFNKMEDVAEWSFRHDIAVGDIQPIDKIWKFAKEWYGRHLAKDWMKWSALEAQNMFNKHGLTHDVWDLQLGSDKGRVGGQCECSTRF